VVTGDFFQLPPVTKHNKSPTFAFEALTWGETVSASVNLTKVFRQRDQTFVDMLNEMRFGRMSTASIEKFAALKREVFYNDGIEPTEL
jgi:ATP-dependent DNA helicase PIF1